MGKVGSVAVNHVLKEHGIDTLHAHWTRNKKPVGEFPTIKPQFGRVVNGGEKLKIITLVREPVARNISAFFQDIVFYKEYIEEKAPVQKMHDVFVKKYNIHYPDQWFELEIMKWFDFDPYKSRFNHKRGYQIYRAGKHEILLIRLEDADRIIGEALYKFLGIKGAIMKYMNSFADKKRIGEIYKEFLRIPFNEDFLDRNYGLRYAQHFYTDAERQSFKENWM